MNIGRISEASAQISATAPKPAEQETEKKSTTLAADNADKFVESKSVYTPAYTKASAGKSTANASTDSEAATVKITSKTALQLKNESMKAYAADTINSQSLFAFSTGTEKTVEEDADYWGSDATAQRIFDFAKNIAGDDDELFQTLKDAVEDGFKQAGKLFSKKTGQDSLPDVCKDTYDKVMTLFDKWEEQIKADKAASDETDEQGIYVQADSKTDE